jgi:ribulose-5-phosphate 4-epimerase/fuculose-1-phosphate aldolase
MHKNLISLDGSPSLSISRSTGIFRRVACPFRLKAATIPPHPPASHNAPISPQEQHVRRDLAAMYRLAALEKWDDLIFTHISARVPGPEYHFLVNPYGLRFAEITASSLVKIDVAGNLVGESSYGVNYAGFVIHSAIHMAREDAQFIIHFHTDDGVAVSGQREGLLPINQRALEVLPILAYHDYEGIAENLSERDRLVADLAGKKAMILRNHGTLALGATPGEAWLNIYNLERACTAQIRTLTAGRDGVLCLSSALQAEVAAQTLQQDGKRSYADQETTELAWASQLRRVAADGYDM